MPCWSQGALFLHGVGQVSEAALECRNVQFHTQKKQGGMCSLQEAVSRGVTATCMSWASHLMLLQGAWAICSWEQIRKPSLNTQTTVYVSESRVPRT